MNQAGRAALFVSLGADTAAQSYERFQRIWPSYASLQAAGIDLVPLALQTFAVAKALADHKEAGRIVVHVSSGADLQQWVIGDAPLMMMVDRGGRIVHIAPLSPDVDLVALCRSLAPRLWT